MNTSALLASLHHLAAFTVVAMLAVEVATFNPPFSAAQARRLQRVDMIFGSSATLLLIIGLMRVTWYEKGATYYWHDWYFLIKFGALHHRRIDLDLSDRCHTLLDQGPESRQFPHHCAGLRETCTYVPDAGAHRYCRDSAMRSTDGTGLRLSLRRVSTRASDANRCRVDPPAPWCQGGIHLR